MNLFKILTPCFINDCCSLFYEMLEEERMRQVKYFMSDKKTNEWIRENQDKTIVDILFSAGGFAVIYEEINL